VRAGLIVLIGAVAFAAGCRSFPVRAAAVVPQASPPWLLSELYESPRDLGSPDADPVPAWPTQPPGLDGVSEVTLQRTACLGSCPSYQVSFHSDGTAEYWGGSYAPRQGHFRAHSGERINYLVGWARALGILDLSLSYSFVVVDAQDSYVAIVKNGQRKILFDPGRLGPANLYAFECMIDSLTSDLHWEPAATSRRKAAGDARRRTRG
jgi:hypothetical protein